MTLENYNELPTEIPVLKEKELIYPFMIIPIFLEKKEDIIAVQKAINDHSLLFVSINDEPGTYGTIGTISRKVTLPEGRVKILFQGLKRGKILEVTDKNPTMAIVDKVTPLNKEAKEVNALLETLKEHILTLSELNPFFPKDFIKIIDTNSDANRIVDIIASSLKLPVEIGYELFKEIDTKERLIKLIHYILEEIESIKLKNELNRKVMEQVQEANREHLLKQQLKLIQQELGMTNELEEEIKEYKEKLEKFLDLPNVKEVRQQGMVTAIELKGYDVKERIGLRIYEYALSRGILLRPLGHVIYFMPPYIITKDQIDLMMDTALEAIVLLER